MTKHLAPMIYVVFLWRRGVALPPYFADSEPDDRALVAAPDITDVCVRKAYLRYD
jgi:hypothetical protein